MVLHLNAPPPPKKRFMQALDLRLVAVHLIARTSYSEASAFVAESVLDGLLCGSRCAGFL